MGLFHLFCSNTALVNLLSVKLNLEYNELLKVFKTNAEAYGKFNRNHHL